MVLSEKRGEGGVSGRERGGVGCEGENEVDREEKRERETREEMRQEKERNQRKRETILTERPERERHVLKKAHTS